jgi:hypothetical protein
MLIAQIIAATFLVLGSALVFRAVMAADLLDSERAGSRRPRPPAALASTHDRAYEWSEHKAA